MPPVVKKEETPISQTPDNPQFDDTAAVIKEALKTVEGVDGEVTIPLEKVETKVAKVETLPADDKDKDKGPESKGWAAILKREKKLQEDRVRLDHETKTQRHELNQMKAQIEQLQSGAVDLKSAFKKDPFGTLKRELGMSFNDLAQLALADDPTKVQPDEGDQVNPMTKKLLEKIEGLEKTITGQSVQRELQSYKADIKHAVSTDELAILTTMPNLENEVLTLAGSYYQKTGERLPADKACAILAKYWEQHLQSLSSHAAARRVLGLPDPTDSTPGKALKPKGPSKTLTNRQLASPPSGDNKVPENLTDEQEIRLAAKLIPDDVWSRNGV